MATHWYYTKDGQNRIGPLSLAQMQEHARAGKLLPGDRVQNCTEANWKIAVEVPGLFDHGGQSPVVTGQRTATRQELLQELKKEVRPFGIAGRTLWDYWSPRTRLLVVGGTLLAIVVLFLTCVGFFQFMLWW